MEIRIPEEISLRKIAESGQCFRWRRAGENGYKIPFGNRMVKIEQLKPDLLRMNCDEEEYSAVWREYLDLNTDYGKMNAKIRKRKDPFLWSAMNAQRGVRILRQDTWEMLITSIITQNRNIPAIQKSVELLSEKAGTKLTDPEGETFFAFPTPEQLHNLPDDCLDCCKLGYRTGYIRSAAEAVYSGAVSPDELRKLPDAECRSRLTVLTGVGEKVAACVMLFGLHRLNAFPMDVWMKRITANEYPGGYPFEEYSPYNGVFQQYMFAYYREMTGRNF